VIAESSIPEDDEVLFAVWVEAVGEIFMVRPRFLTSTGERMPPPQPGRIASSTRVDERGRVLGRETYVIVDQVERNL
jgi:hypothetical protein